MAETLSLDKWLSACQLRCLIAKKQRDLLFPSFSEKLIHNKTSEVTSERYATQLQFHPIPKKERLSPCKIAEQVIENQESFGNQRIINY